MSGAEVIAVLGVISSIVSIVDGIKKVYDAATNAQGLPEAFREVAGRLPIVVNTLDSTKQDIEERKRNNDSCKGVKQVVEACKEKAIRLEELFSKAIPAEGSSDLKRYCKAVKALGKGNEVESLMKGILEDVQLLACEHGMKTATKAQQEQISKAIIEISAVSPSVPEQEFQETGFTNTNFGSGTQNNALGEYVAQGTARQYVSHGPMSFEGTSTAGQTDFNANTQNFHSRPNKDEAQTCLSALFLTDPMDDRAKLINTKGRRVDGTCQWIKSHAVYDSWLRSQSQLLWLSGGPGKGKTMLSIFLAEELEETAKISQNKLFVQYFCDNKDEKRNTAVTVLRGLIFQLLQSRPKLSRHILPRFRTRGKSLFLFEGLWSVFESMVCDPTLETTYCVLDGLDECDEASLEVLLRQFAALFSTKTVEPSACHLNLLIVSRDLPDLIPELLSIFPRISLDAAADVEISQDINLFINAKVKELSRYQHYSKALRVHVNRVFRERAQGTFLWIGIVAKALGRKKKIEVEEALKKFPSGLDELYARILLQIDSSRQMFAAKILRWVVMAVRPLTLLELSLAIEPTVNPSIVADRDDRIRDQVSYCGDFLVIKEDEEDKEVKVGLIHQSVKDYLLRKTWDSSPELEIFRVKEEVANLEIARECLNCLQSGGLEYSGHNLLKDTTHLKAFPLLSYAVLHWHQHASSLARSEDIFDLSHAFYQKNSPVRTSWLKAYFTSETGGQPPEPFPLLMLASYFGILPLAENIVLREDFRHRRITRHRSAILDETDSEGMTALIWAAAAGHEAIVRLLLENGADIEAKDRWGQAPLIMAAARGHNDIVRLLLERGASAENKRGNTPLMIAAMCDHEDIVRLLLNEGADLNAKNIQGETPLILAAMCGHNDIVRLLLNEGADLNAKDKEENTLLMTAAMWNNKDIVRLLLNEGADPNAKNKEGETPLIMAATCDYKDIVRLLLNEGADLNAKNKEGATPLIMAATLGHDDIVRLLLNEGADLNAKTKEGNTSLMMAATCDHKDIVRLLLNEGADLNAKNKEGATPLIMAATLGHDDIVRLLLNEGADLNAKTKEGNTSLMMATKCGYEDTVRLLLDKGADINAENISRETALIIAVRRGDKDAARLLTHD